MNLCLSRCWPKKIQETNWGNSSFDFDLCVLGWITYSLFPLCQNEGLGGDGPPGSLTLMSPSQSKAHPWALHLQVQKSLGTVGGGGPCCHHWTPGVVVGGIYCCGTSMGWPCPPHRVQVQLAPLGNFPGNFSDAFWIQAYEEGCLAKDLQNLWKSPIKMCMQYCLSKHKPRGVFWTISKYWAFFFFFFWAVSGWITGTYLRWLFHILLFLWVTFKIATLLLW